MHIYNYPPPLIVSTDSKSPFSMMGSSTPNDSHEVTINTNEEGIQPKPSNEVGGDQKKAKPSGQKETTSDQPISKKVKGMYGGLKGSLHRVGAIVKPVVGKFINVDEHDSEREESNAYKELMEQVEEEIVDRFPAKLWVVNGLLFILLIVFLTTSATIRGIRQHGVLLHMRMHSWAAFLLAVISGLPAVQLLTFIVSEPFVWIFKMKRYTVLFARMLKRSVDVTLWFTLVLWVWYTWYRPQVIKDTSGARLLGVSPEEYKHTLNIVVKETTRLLMALTVAAFLWTVKRAAFFKLLVDLHFVDLCDRIRQTILDFTAIRYIEKKSEQPEINGNEAAGAEPNGDDGSHIIEKLNWVNVSYLRKETTPIWILKRLIDMYMDYYTKKKTHRRSKILQRLEESDDNEILMYEAKKMLKNLMRGHPQDSDIDREVLKQYGLDDNKVDHVFKLFASKKDTTVQIITQEQFLRWAIKAIKNCKGLKRTIESSQNVFWKLELLLSLCVVVVSLVICLLLSEMITTAQIAILLTPFISASFVFSDSLKRTFDCLIFVFGMHPFDVGDRVIIDKVDLKVEEMYILTTVFTRCDTGVEANYPNSELSTKSIINLEIEPEEFDSIEFFIPYDTPQELVCDLQIKIKKTLDDNITFTSDTTVAKKQITSGKKVTMSVYFKYLVTYHSAETRAQHRSKVLCKIIRMCKEMEIEMRRFRNEMKLALKRPSTSLLGEEEEATTNILRFQIDAKVKLPKIEDLKKTVFSTIQDYDSRLKGCSQAIFTGINKEKLTMDVRMRHCTGLFKTDDDDDRKELKEKIVNAINEEKRVEVSWLPKTDWDDDC